MAKLLLEAETSERMGLPPSRVWERASQLPEAFDYFPLINRATEVSAGERYDLELGPFGYRSFSTNVDCQVTVELRAEEEIRFVSVPGTGNADVEVAMTIDDDGDDDGCILTATLLVRPRIPIPRLVPKGVLERTASATLRAGLQHSMRSFRRELEGDA